MVFRHCAYRASNTERTNNMASLWKILNNEDESEEDDMATVQQRHSGFVFTNNNNNNNYNNGPSGPQSPVDSSDIAIQTLHALADLHASHMSLKRERMENNDDSSSSPSLSPTQSSPSLSSSSRHYKSEPISPSRGTYNNNNNSNNLSNCSRREYKKKQLVVRPELMQMKQAKAAVKLGIPPSTFSKRWRESLPERKWPYRVHKKVEKSIQMLKVLQGKGHDVTVDLRRLMTQRELNLKPAIITMFEDVNETFELDPPANNNNNNINNNTNTKDSSLSALSPPSSPQSGASSPISPPLSPSSPSSPVAQVPLGASDGSISDSTSDNELIDATYNSGHVPIKKRKLMRSD